MLDSINQVNIIVMRVNFGTYTYFNPNDTDKKSYDGTKSHQNKAYNSSYFNNLIRKRRYDDAANYASQFHFNDVETQREHENDIIELKRQGRMYASIYGRLEEEQDYINEATRNRSNLRKVEFAENVFKDGGLNSIDQDNYYLQMFNADKNKIGNGENGEIATSLSITFNPKRTFLGWDGGRRDRTEFSFETFLVNSGLSEQDLIDAGIQISKVDSKTIIKFNKSNPLANRIIYGMPDDTVTWDLITWGETSSVENHAPTVVGYDAKGREIKSSNKNNLNYINSCKYYLKDCLEQRDVAFGGKTGVVEEGVKYYSSTIGASLIDGMDELNAAYARGDIDPSYYNSEMSRLDDFISSSVKVLGSGSYKMYTNAYNENVTDESLNEISDIQRGHIIGMLSSANPKNIHLNAMVSNGQIGTLITVDGIAEDPEKLSKESSPEDMYKTRRTEIFIPGFLSEVAQQKINSDTSTRSVQELNSMQDFGYEYTLASDKRTVTNSNGETTEINSVIKPDGKGGFLYNNNPITQEEALRMLDKDMMLEVAMSELKYKFINIDNELYDEKNYRNQAQQIAIGIANSLFPDIYLTNAKREIINMANMKISDIDYIFSKKGAGNVISDDASKNISWEEAKKYNEIFDIYTKLMSELLYYKK